MPTKQLPKTQTPRRIIISLLKETSIELKKNRTVKKVEIAEEHDIHLFVFTSDHVIQVQGYPGLSPDPKNTVIISIYKMDRNAFIDARRGGKASIGNEGHIAGQQVLEASVQIPPQTSHLLKKVESYTSPDEPDVVAERFKAMLANGLVLTAKELQRQTGLTGAQIKETAADAYWLHMDKRSEHNIAAQRILGTFNLSDAAVERARLKRLSRRKDPPTLFNSLVGPHHLVK